MINVIHQRLKMTGELIEGKVSADSFVDILRKPRNQRRIGDITLLQKQRLETLNNRVHSVALKQP